MADCPVVVVASNSDPAVSTSVTCKNKDGTSQTVSCPSAVALYNKYMGGVNHNDQLWGYTTMSIPKEGNTINIFSGFCLMLPVPTHTF